MRQLAITTEISIMPLVSRQPIEAFMSEADKLHGRIVHRLQTCPEDELIMLLQLDELLSNAVVELSGAAARWK